MTCSVHTARLERSSTILILDYLICVFVTIFSVIYLLRNCYCGQSVMFNFSSYKFFGKHVPNISSSAIYHYRIFYRPRKIFSFDIIALGRSYLVRYFCIGSNGDDTSCLFLPCLRDVQNC